MKKLLCLALLLLMIAVSLPGIAQKLTAEGPAQQASSGIKELDPAWENILLIGADTRENLKEEGRADAIIIASVNRESGAVRLISLARDMWIDLPGERGYNRINTAFRFGGSELMMQAVNETVGLNISRYAAINFYGFCDVIDALGGVEVELTRAEANHINQTLAQSYGSSDSKHIPGEGLATLSGAQALAFARIRKVDNDHGRTQRQRDVLVSILNKLKTLGLKEQLAFVRESLACVSTNLNLVEIMTLGIAVLSGGMEDVSQLGLPSAGHFQYKTQNGMSTIDFDADALREEAHAFIYGGSVQE